MWWPALLSYPEKSQTVLTQELPNITPDSIHINTLLLLLLLSHILTSHVNDNWADCFAYESNISVYSRKALDQCSVGRKEQAINQKISTIPLHKCIVYTDTQNTASSCHQPKGSVLSIQTWKLLFHNTIDSVFILPESLYALCQIHSPNPRAESTETKKLYTHTG